MTATSSESDSGIDLGYICFDCPAEFESLDDMVFIDGRGRRDGRHFCPSCARDCRRTPEDAYNTEEA